jgi:archaellum component FlaF (FlaF/FlaG flagellin family)
MDSIIAGIIILFLILFAILTLSGAFVEAQEMLATTWETRGDAMQETLSTRLSMVSARYTSGTNTAYFVFRNDGTTHLSDFETWDVIVQYYDLADPAVYRTAWLPFRAGAPNLNEWSVSGIFADEAQDKPEVFERTLLNPGEELRIAVLVDPTLGAGNPMQLTLASPDGIAASGVLTRNVPPQLEPTALLTLALPSRSSADITSAMIDIIDDDDPPRDLVFTVETPPAQGALNLGERFTQADIDAGLLSYTHTGTGDDSFVFTVGDGEDSIGPFIFTITASNAAPVLATNAGLTLNALTTASISAGRLTVGDVDNAAAELTYTVATAPAQGALSLGGSFTQADIDAGLLSYTHTGVGSDTFSFNVGDGTNTIGLYWFNITVP